MGDLTKSFSRHEFACHCGCGHDTVDAELLMLCEVVREIEGSPITPNSGSRCAKHNAKIGGKKSSFHLIGRAADLPVKNPGKVYAELCNRFPGKYGFGLYATFIHVDSRSGPPARWSG